MKPVAAPGHLQSWRHEKLWLPTFDFLGSERHEICLYHFIGNHSPLHPELRSKVHWHWLVAFHIIC